MSGNNGAGGGDTARAKALARFKAIQSEADGAMGLAREAEGLQLLLEETAQEYDQLADDWMLVGDPVQSDRTREQAMQVRSFAQEAGKCPNMSADDARHQIDKIHKALHDFAVGHVQG